MQATIRATPETKAKMHIKQDSKAVLKLLNNFDPGAEIMIIRLLYALTESDPLDAAFINTVKGMYVDIFLFFLAWPASPRMLAGLQCVARLPPE